MTSKAIKKELRELGASIKEYREHQGLTQAELAEKTGMKVPYISRIENGKVDLQLSSALRILDALDISYKLEIDPNLW